MEIQLKFTAQIKNVVGNSTDSIGIQDGAKLQDLLRSLVLRYGKDFESILFDDRGSYRHSNLIVINQTLERFEDNVVLVNGMEVTLMAPISGG